MTAAAILNFGKNVNNSGLDKDICTIKIILCEDASRPCGDDRVTKSRNRKLIRVTSSNERLKHKLNASISVTITDTWTKFGTDLKYHTVNRPEWSNSQPQNTRCRLPPSWIFRLCEIKNASSSGLDEDICIKFYGIMHWTLAYTTACTSLPYKP